MPPAAKQSAQKTAKSAAFDLEKALAELDGIVEQLESGDLPLEKSLQSFEDGIRLTRQCQQALREAEQKVDILLKQQDAQETGDNGDEILLAFDDADGSDLA